MIEELETYIASRGPKARRFLTRAAKDMSEEQQRNFLGSLQLGDTEFQAAVAPYMPKGAEIDPSRARLETFPIQDIEGEGVAPKGLSWKGKDYEELKVRDPNVPDGFQSILIEPETVNAIQARNANPQVWAHEYKHFEDSDGGSEYTNRLMDLMAAQNYGDVVTAMRSTALEALNIATLRKFRLETDPRYKGSEYDAERRRVERDHELATNIYTSVNPAVREDKISEGELYDHLDNLFDITSTQLAVLGIAGQTVRGNKPAEGRFFKNRKKRGKINRTKESKMPKNYREGGRVRLI
jgi:hypothetical protein